MIKDGYLILKNKKFKIRYMTCSHLVLDTDLLFGEYGDEFPLNNLSLS
jgi:hypothetical protein